jgi:hypothetical protein
MDAVITGSIENAPIVIFAVVAVTLLFCMVRS